MSVADVRHPLFARFFDRLSRAMEREVGARRDELLAGLSGRVVEIAAWIVTNPHVLGAKSGGICPRRY